MMQGEKDKGRLERGQGPDAPEPCKDLGCVLCTVQSCRWVLGRTVMEMNKVGDKQGEQELLVMIWTKGGLGWNQSGCNGCGKTGQIPGIS